MEQNSVASIADSYGACGGQSPKLDHGSINPVVTNKLVLVESLLKEEIRDGEDDRSSTGKKDGHNSSSGFKDAHEAGRSELTPLIQHLTQQMQFLINYVTRVDFTNVLTGLTQSIESLGIQVRELQLYNIRNIIQPPKMNGMFTDDGLPKQGNIATGMNRFSTGQIFQTPRKLAMPPFRLDVTPPTVDYQARVSSVGNLNDSGYNSSNGQNHKRSLTFPKSLTKILDAKSEEHHNGLSMSTDNVEGTYGLESGPQPQQSAYTSFVRIKEEPDADPLNNSPTALLVLAEAALNRTSEDICSIQSSEGWTASDSGASTSSTIGCYPTMSSLNETKTSPSQMEVTKSSKNGKSFKRRRSECKKKLPKPPASESSGTSSGEVKERRTRKRRKVKEPLPCSYCGKAFNNQSSLRQHESFHRPTRPFTCSHETCEKAYKTRSELNRHLVVHSGEKKHFCKLCGKRFLRKQYLKTHLIRHHETGITMVTPAVADNGAEGNGKATPVITVASSSFVTQPEPLTWRCTLCYKIFVNNEDLNKHMRSYHEKRRNEKPKM